MFSKAETLAEIAAERAAEQAKKEEETAQSSADPRPDPQKPLPFPTEPEQDEEEKFYVDICSLPASAGTGVYLDDSSTEPLQIVHTDIAERANYAVRVSGDSMMPEYNDGDIVLVETCRSVEVGEIGIFVVDGEGYIKKYGGDRLISLNSKYKDMLLKRYEAVYCRGRVLGIAEVVD
ncbi:MAG: S24 family peptidase [Oscillospiraceae bacterium]|nr:S24 family peptidase [Oscillospiraceae bacterium]